MKLIGVIAFLILFFSQGANAKDQEISETDKSMVFKTTDRLATCAGFFEAMSWLATRAGKKESAIDYHNYSNGWNTVSSYTLYSTGVVTDWKKAISYSNGVTDSSAQSFKSSLELDVDKGSKEMSAFFEKECKDLADYQVDKIQEIRKLMATQK